MPQKNYYVYYQCPFCLFGNWLPPEAKKVCLACLLPIDKPPHLCDVVVAAEEETPPASVAIGVPTEKGQAWIWDASGMEGRER